nr:hypothetical protein [Tanacetum cinerariifolium]
MKINLDSLGVRAWSVGSQKGLKTPRIIKKRCCCANKLRKVFFFKQSNLTGKLTRMQKLMNKNWKHITATWKKIEKHCDQSESTSNTCLVEKDDSDVTPNSPDMCEHDIQTDQNAEDERDALANLIANLKFDIDENKKIQKQLKKENTSLAHELEQ